MFNKTGDIIPQYYKSIKIPLNKEISSIFFDNIKYIPLKDEEKKLIKKEVIQKDIKINYYTTNIGNENYLILSFTPIKNNANNYEKISSFTIKYTTKEKTKSTKSNIYKNHSVLKEGKWIKVAVNKDGLYKMSFEELNTYE